MNLFNKFLIASMATITAVSLGAFNVEAQNSKASEGVARQILALRAMLDSYAGATNTRISNVETDITSIQGDITSINGDISTLQGDVTGLTTRVGNIEGTLNDHTRCFNRGTPSIYWPRHPEANGNGCVRHTDIVAEATPIDPPASCNGATQSWGLNNSCSATHGPMPHGTTATYRKGVTGNICQNSNQYTGSIQITCTDGVLSRSNANCTLGNYYDEPTCRGSCFTSDTLVTMADGSNQDIHTIKVGDKLLGSDGKARTVLALDRPLLWKGKDQRLIEINGDKAFTTDNHPIMTEGGWKAVNPDMAEKEAFDQLAGKIGKLEVGDMLIMAKGETVKVESIKVLPQEERERRLYNLLLDGDHTYYANGLLVHGSVPDKGGKYPLANEHNGEPE
jgi:hypothetical protein